MRQALHPSWPVLVLAIVAARASRPLADGGGGQPCFNQLQMLATHNSYHLAPNEAVSQLLESPLAQALLPPALYLPYSWQYSHRTLTQQLDEGVRALELDVHADPEGGLYAQSAGLRLAGLNGTLDAPELRQPGFKVLHMPDFDFNSTCWLLTDCLAEVKHWSDAHPRHLPITIYVEVKPPDDIAAALGPEALAVVEAQLAASKAPGPDRLAQSPDFNASLLQDLESEVLAVLNESALITPDYVLERGDASANLTDLLLVPPAGGRCSYRTILKGQGQQAQEWWGSLLPVPRAVAPPCSPWPDLDDMRGKFLLVLIFTREEHLTAYEELHPSGEGSLFWLVSSAGLDIPQAVFYNAAESLDMETAEAAGIEPGQLPANISDYLDAWEGEAASRVRQGYIVRARVDQDTIEARHNFTERRDVLLGSGSQLILTDYPYHPSQLLPSTYEVSIPGGKPARCVNGATGRAASGTEADDVSCS